MLQENDRKMILPMMVGATVLLKSLSPLPFEEPKQPVPQTFVTVKSKYEIELDEKKREEALWKDGTLTNYCNCHDKLNGETGVTAYGYNLDDGILYQGYRILAGDKSIDFGTIISIKYRDGNTVLGVVLDRGGAIRGSHFDMVAKSRQEALDFGRQPIKYKVVREGWGK